MGVALALLAIGSSSASASVRWRLNNTPIVEAPVGANVTGAVTLTAVNIPLVGTAKLECQATGTGSVGTNAAGAVQTFALSGCVGIKNCSLARAEAVHLSWNTELTAVETTVHNKAVSGSGGAPGFTIECSWGRETCTGTIGSTTTNTESGVTETIDPNEKLSCSLGGSGSGTLEGSLKVTNAEGVLSAVSETQPSWLYNGSPLVQAKAVNWSGKVQFQDELVARGTWTVTCADTGTGKAGAVANGEMSQWTFTNCESLQCRNATLSAVRTPWHTELFAGAAGAENEISSSGSGKPAIKMTCPELGVVDECPVPPTKMTNNESGTVGAAFREEKTNCLEGHRGTGKVTGTQTLQLTEGGSLSVS
ncbi:MAG: hypothetical protein ACTHNP_07115 [Solirubrobacterales bacterium]